MNERRFEPYTKTPIAELLNDAGFFQSLNPSQQEIFVTFLNAYQVPPKTILMKENYENDILFYVCEGSIDIFKQDVSAPRLIRTMQKMTFLGEWSFFDHKPCFADVITSTDCIITTLNRSNFLELSNESPHCALAFALELFRSLTGKLRQANMELFSHS